MNHPRFTRAQIGIGVFTAAYLLAAAVGAAVMRNGEFVFYLVIMLVLVGVVLAIHRRCGFSTALLAALSVWGAAHMAGGLVPVPESWPINGDQRVLYSWWIVPWGGSGVFKYDNLIHAYGFGITTWACWQGLRASVGDVSPTLGRLVLCSAAAQGFGALNEVIEFVATLLGPSNVGGYVNTALDMVWNLVGTVMAAACIALASGRRETVA